jgi:hypothetical protein
MPFPQCLINVQYMGIYSDGCAWIGEGVPHPFHMGMRKIPPPPRRGSTPWTALGEPDAKVGESPSLRRHGVAKPADRGGIEPPLGAPAKGAGLARPRPFVSSRGRARWSASGRYSRCYRYYRPGPPIVPGHCLAELTFQANIAPWAVVPSQPRRWPARPPVHRRLQQPAVAALMLRGYAQSAYP